MSRSQYVPLAGGLDLVTPPSQANPGSASAIINYECPVTGGYRRIEGYTKQGTTVPGEGPILGVFTFEDTQYAIRKDVGAASATLYYNNAGTWTSKATGLNPARHELAEGNFYATDAGKAIYGVGGGKPWELKKDGTFTVLTNAPSGASYIAVHANHLFVGFPVGSLQFSGIGDPANWDASTGGAGEIGVSDRLTGMLPGVGGILHVFCGDSIKTLRGSSSANFTLETTVPQAGCRPYSMQTMRLPYFVTERGIASLEATQRFGDFTGLYPSKPVEPLFTTQNKADMVVASSINRRKGQYRIFFSDKYGLYVSPAGISEVTYPDQVSVAHSAELSDGTESNLIGDDAGQVHRLDDGDGFNGVAIPAFITLAFTDLGAPDLRKRYRRVYWDIRSGSQAQLFVQPDFDYGSTETSRPPRNPIDYNLGGGIWNYSNWNEFYWSIPTIAQEPVDVAGTGVSINFSIYSESLRSPHELVGYDLHFDVRRQRRG